MKRMLLILSAVLVIVAAMLLAGCGDDDESRADKIAACLKKTYGDDFVSTNENDLDVIAANAPDGALVVSAEKQQINIGLHKGDATADEAIKIYRKSQAPPKRVERDGTAVIAWIVKPTAQEEQTVRACIAQS
jgi:major membrane immunogen (membrane-anchored lipoprotein)